MHPYLKQFSHFNPDAHTLSLRNARITVPVFKDNRDEDPKLAVISIEPVYGTELNLSRAYHTYVSRFMVNAHGDDTSAVVKQLVGTERIFVKNDRGTKNPPKCIARPTLESIALACSLTAEQIGKNILCDVPGGLYHIGALFSAIQTLGHIVTADGRYCDFPLYCLRHLPPIKLLKLEEVIPYDKPYVIPRMYIGQFNIAVTPPSEPR